MPPAGLPPIGALEYAGVCAIVADFLTELPAQIAKLLNLAAKADWKEFEQLAHSVRGISASIGLGVLPAKFRELEEAAAARQVEVIRATMPAIEAVAKESGAALTAWLAGRNQRPP